MNNNNLITICCTLMLATCLPMAYAGESSGSISVSAQIEGSCSVTADALQFGSIDPIANGTTPTDAETIVKVTCANGTEYQVALDGGNTGTATDRELILSGDGTSALSYGIYLDEARTTNWDDTGGTNTNSGTGSGAAQAYTAYGRVNTGHTTAPTGNYSDIIAITVSF